MRTRLQPSTPQPKPHRLTARNALLWNLGVAMVFAFAAFGGSPAGYREYQVKAVWMLNFTRFVEWPADAFPTRDAPCIVGVLGKDPFGDDLEAALRSKTFKGRRFELLHVQRESEAARCHMLFIPAGERRVWRDLQTRLKQPYALVIGEAEDFLDQGSSINFVIQDGSITFEIDLRNAQKAQLKINANLLKIAAKVKGRYE